MKKPRTRDRILDEALRLFATHGFEGTSISDIERAVGLAPGTGSFHRHFPSKQAVLEQTLENELARLRTIRPERFSTAPTDQVVLAAQIRAELNMLRETQQLSALLMHERNNPSPVVARVREVMVDGGIRGLVADHLEAMPRANHGEAEKVAGVRMAAIVGYFLTSQYFPDPVGGMAEDAFADALAALLLGGSAASRPEPKSSS